MFYQPNTLYLGSGFHNNGHVTVIYIGVASISSVKCYYCWFYLYDYLMIVEVPLIHNQNMNLCVCVCVNPIKSTLPDCPNVTMLMCFSQRDERHKDAINAIEDM